MPLTRLVGAGERLVRTVFHVAVHALDRVAVPGVGLVPTSLIRRRGPGNAGPYVGSDGDGALGADRRRLSRSGSTGIRPSDFPLAERTAQPRVGPDRRAGVALVAVGVRTLLAGEAPGLRALKRGCLSPSISPARWSAWPTRALRALPDSRTCLDEERPPVWPGPRDRPLVVHHHPVAERLAWQSKMLGQYLGVAAISTEQAGRVAATLDPEANSSDTHAARELGSGPGEGDCEDQVRVLGQCPRFGRPMTTIVIPSAQAILRSGLPPGPVVALAVVALADVPAAVGIRGPVLPSFSQGWCLNRAGPGWHRGRPSRQSLPAPLSCRSPIRVHRGGSREPLGQEPRPLGEFSLFPSTSLGSSRLARR